MWEVVKLGDVCEVVAGQSPEGKYYNTEGNGLAFYQGKKDFGEKYIGSPSKWTTQITKEAQAGDILMSVRAPVGPINFATEQICIGRGLAAIRPSAKINKDFLFYGLLEKQKEICGNEGAVFSSINKAQISAINFPLPPLEEQKRIVAILDEAFAGIDEAIAGTEKNIQNARDLFESHLNTIFTQKGEGWEETKLEKCCSTSQGVQIPKSQQKSSLEEGFKRYYYISDFTHDKNLKYVEDKYPNKIITPDDIIVVNTGASAGNIFKGQNGILSNNLFKVSILPSKITSDYLYYFVTSKTFKDFQTEIVRGTANPHMGHKNFGMTPINLPPLELQNQLLSSFVLLELKIETLKNTYQQKLTALKDLKQSLLQQAFAGELTADLSEAA